MRTALLACALAAAAGAQEVEPDAPRPRDEAARMVDAYILSNMQDSLGLSDEQFVKLLPLVKRLQADRRDFVMRRMEAMRELRRLLRGGGSEARALELLKQVKTLDLEHPDRVRKDLEAIDAVLTPVQQAKFRVFEMEVDVRIRGLMNQIRRQNRPLEPRPRDRDPLPP